MQFPKVTVRGGHWQFGSYTVTEVCAAGPYLPAHAVFVADTANSYSFPWTNPVCVYDVVVKLVAALIQVNESAGTLYCTAYFIPTVEPPLVGGLQLSVAAAEVVPLDVAARFCGAPGGAAGATALATLLATLDLLLVLANTR